MKRIILIFLAFILIAAALTACGSNNNQNISNDSHVNQGASDRNDSSDSNDKISIVTTIFPQYDFIREIAGDHVELSMLLTPGSESHSFEPTPQDIIRIQNCDMFIYVGGESESWVDDILESVDTGNMEIISLMELVDTVEEEVVEGMEEEAEEVHGETEAEAEVHIEAEVETKAVFPEGEGTEEEIEYDEHVWTSPKNAIAIVKALSNRLCALDTDNASIYEQNTAAYIEKLTELDNAFREAVSAGSRKTLIFGDRFPFRYLADAYGLDYFAAFPGCSTETEASAATIAFLIDKVKEENIPVVFHLEMSSGKMADTICEAAGAEKLLLHSCHNITKNEVESGVTYLELMTQNVENLKEALN